MYACLLHPSLVQSFVGSRWIGRSRAALMSSTASCSTFIVSPMWSCWWATPTCTATSYQSTTMTTTIKPSPLPALYSGCSCRGKVSTEEVFEQRVLVSTCLLGQICFAMEMQTKVLCWLWIVQLEKWDRLLDRKIWNTYILSIVLILALSITTSLYILSCKYSKWNYRQFSCCGE